MLDKKLSNELTSLVRTVRQERQVGLLNSIGLLIITLISFYMLARVLFSFLHQCTL